MLKALIFDCYGTLISTGNGSVEATKEILNNIGSNLDPVEFYRKWKELHKEHSRQLKHFTNEKNIFIKDLKVLFKIHNIKKDHKIHIEPMLNSLYGRKIYNDVVDNIKILKKDYHIFIASNSDTEPLLENIGNECYLFDGIYTSEILKSYKPSKIFFDKLIKKIKYRKEEVLYIGDSIEDDIIGSNNFGIMNVLINRDNKEIYDIKANYVIKSFYELRLITGCEKRRNST